MRRRLAFVFVAVLIATGKASATGPESDRSWYLNLGAGHSAVTYPGTIGRFFHDVEEIGGVDNFTAHLDLGLYFPVGSHLILGPSVSRTSDRMSVQGEHVWLNQFLTGGSAMIFPFSRVGHGFFARGDAGLGWARFRTTSGLFGIDMTTDQKLGFLVGGGYAIAPSGGPRILLTGSWARRNLEDNEGDYGWSGTTNIGVSLLF